MWVVDLDTHNLNANSFDSIKSHEISPAKSSGFDEYKQRL